MFLQQLKDTFRSPALGAMMVGVVTLASFSPAASAQDQIANAPAGQSSVEHVDKRGAWKASKENGGTLVIWYDARYHDDAMASLKALQMLGKRNVVAKAGLNDGTFMMIGAGNTSPVKYTIRDVRDGTFLDDAQQYANRFKIAHVDFDDGVPDVVQELDRQII